MTPLHYTTANGVYPEIIQFLLNHAADRTIKNNNRKAALDIAKEMGNKKMITILSKWILLPYGAMEQKESKFVQK